MSDAVKLPLATIADLLAIPEAHRRHEVIDGSLIEKEAASGRHGGAQARLSRTLGPYDRRPGGRWPGGWWFATEVEVLFEDTQVFRPDVAGWRRERLAELPAEVPIMVRPRSKLLRRLADSSDRIALAAGHARRASPPRWRLTHSHGGLNRSPKSPYGFVTLERSGNDSPA